MKTLFSTDLSREGNDVYIYETIFVVEHNGIYAVLQSYKVVGWSKQAEIYLHTSTTDYDTAIVKYKELGGML